MVSLEAIHQTKVSLGFSSRSEEEPNVGLIPVPKTPGLDSGLLGAAADVTAEKGFGATPVDGGYPG